MLETHTQQINTLKEKKMCNAHPADRHSEKKMKEWLQVRVLAVGTTPPKVSSECRRICPSYKNADKSRGSKGLVSADRSEAAALLGTTPRSLPKSSASDFAPLSTAEGYPRSRTRSSYSPGPECAGIGLVPSWR